MERSRAATGLARVRHALACGLRAFHLDRCRAVDDAVDDDVRCRLLPEPLVPSDGCVLRAQYERFRSVERFYELENLARLLAGERLQKPAVEHQDVAPDVALLQLRPFLVFPDTQLIEQLREPRLAYGQERIARSDA